MIHKEPPVQQIQRWEVRDETADIYNACTAVCLTVALAMHKVINAQAGASTAAIVARCTANRLSDDLSHFAKCVTIVANGIGSDIWRLQYIINHHVRTPDFHASLFLSIVECHSKVTFDRTPLGEATRAAVKNVYLDVIRAVADVVTAHVNTSQPSAESVCFIDKLFRGVVAGASETARIVAEAATSDDPPPPYTP